MEPVAEFGVRRRTGWSFAEGDYFTKSNYNKGHIYILCGDFVAIIKGEKEISRATVWDQDPGEGEYDFVLDYYPGGVPDWVDYEFPIPCDRPEDDDGDSAVRVLIRQPGEPPFAVGGLFYGLESMLEDYVDENDCGDQPFVSLWVKFHER